MTARPDRYAVMGNPIGHSQSPRIHTLFAAQTHQFMEYRAILVEAGGLAAAIAAFRADGGRGLNITVPFKQDAWVYADILSARAERAGAVNTLLFRRSGEAFGDNTDGVGLLRDLTVNHAIDLAGKRILLVGAGGAARGILQPLLATGPATLVIVNRTADKAVKLALMFSDFGSVFGCGFSELAGRRFEVIIDATAAGLNGQIPPLPDDILVTGGCCYDLMYGAEPTAFVRWGREHGAAQALDGLGMLVEQAAESFYLWRGVRPETQAVIARLRGQ